MRTSLLSLAALLQLCAGSLLFAQDSGIHLSLDADSKTTAESVGLPAYPGAVIAKDSDKDGDSAANLGLSFGDFHFVLKVVRYKTPDPSDKVLGFYRKPLGRYGEVLECDRGQPVGALKVAKSGLTCADKNTGDHGTFKVNGDDTSDDHELRAGAPRRFHIVAIDDKHSGSGSTSFSLVYLELPKNTD